MPEDVLFVILRSSRREKAGRLSELVSHVDWRELKAHVEQIDVIEKVIDDFMPIGRLPFFLHDSPSCQMQGLRMGS